MVNAAAKDNLWVKEVTRGTEVLTDMYKFGVENDDESYAIQTGQVGDMNTVETMGTRTATFTQGNKYADTVTASYIMVNSAPLYFMLGTDSYATEHTITAHATTAKPSRTWFRQGNSATEKYKWAGLVSKQLQIFYKPGEALRCTESCMGMGHGVSTDTPTVNATTWPTANTGVFDVKSTFSVNGVTTYNYEECSWSIAQALKPYGNNSGVYRGMVDTRPIIYTFTANLTGDITALRTLMNAGTGHNFTWKVVKSAAPSTNYLQFAFTGTMYVISILDKYMLNDATDRAVVVWMGSNPTITSYDGHTTVW